MSFTPSAMQAAAIRATVDWFRNGTDIQQVFRLFGYAGSEKSTILTHAIAALGLNKQQEPGRWISRVLFAAFTGKAALVMTRRAYQRRRSTA